MRLAHGPNGRPAVASASLLASLLWLSSCDDDQSGSAPSSTSNPLAAGSTTAPRPFESLRGLKEYVGRVAQSDLYVGFVTGTLDGHVAVTAYFCDGNSIASWFDGLADGEIPSRSGDRELRYRIEGDDVIGTATLANGETVDFKATAVDPDDPSGAGFYVAWQDTDPTFGDREWGGWIVLPDGSQRGALLVRNQVVSTGQLDLASGAVTTSLGRTTPTHVDYIPFAVSR